MKKSIEIISVLVLAVLLHTGVNAQNIPTLEMTRAALPTNFGFGTSTTPMTATFQNDLLNNSTFVANSPTTTVTVSFRNQQFTGLNYGSAAAGTAQSTGLVFGAGPSLATDPIAFGATPYNTYNIIGEYGGNGGPVDNMFTSNPKATGAELGTGIKVQGSTNTTNGAFEIFTTAEALYGSANGIGSRVYFGDVVLTFSQPVINPVIHVAGLGGSYRYLKAGFPDQASNYVSSFFTTELDMANTGLTSTLMSGNAYIALNGNNIANNNHVNPNGGSIVDPLEAPFNNVGAATGSVRLNGTVQEVVYHVYLQSGTGSAFAWSVDKSLINNATRDPFTGDIWYIAASLDKPVQQITGNVFDDADGLNDAGGGDINKSSGVANKKTNAGGLNANLVLGGVVVATTAVSNEGTYLFDNVAPGVYTVQISTTSNTTVTLPSGWVSTGEFNAATPGSDGTVDGKSAAVTVLANDIKTNINFGIERVPDSKNFVEFIGTPALNLHLALHDTLDILTGNDPEDMPALTVLTGKTLKITTLPTNTTLQYNGANVTVGQIITNYNPALLVVFFNQPTALTHTEFNYAYIDLAGKPDPTPALYQLVWTSHGPLAVTLKDFTATGVDCGAKIDWTTTNDVNVASYVVEVSTNNQVSFVPAATVTPAGTANDHSYETTYAMRSGVVYYYRLKMTNFDGTISYSAIRILSCGDKGTIVIAPNPVHDVFNINGMASGKNTIVIFSADGKMMMQQTISGTSGPVNIAKFTAGTYVVRIAAQDGTIFTGQIIKK